MIRIKYHAAGTPPATLIYLSILGFRTNEIMRVLTVISSIFIPSPSSRVSTE